MGIARPCRRGSSLVVLTFLACVLSLAIAIAASQSLPSNSFATRYEQALTETLQLSPQLKEIYSAARLRDAVPDVDDEESDVIGEENGSRRQLKDAPKKQFGLNPPPLNSGPSMADVNNTFFRFDSVTPNAVVDWRQTMYISPIQRQYLVMAAAAFLNGRPPEAEGGGDHLLARHTTLLFRRIFMSPSHRVAACSSSFTNASRRSMSQLTSFPRRLSFSCRVLPPLSPLPPSPPQITGWELVPPYSAQALMKAVSMQPVVAFLSGSAQDFQQYSSRGQLKIYDGLCTTDINHAVLVVGYNYTGSSLAGSYWILKNTWFNTWGDGGYMYLAMSPDVRGKCGIHAYVAFRVFNQPIFDGIAFSIPAMYPVYYPSGPQPVKMNNGPISRADDGNDGRWWTRAYTAAADACSGINPCGAGRCYTRAGMARCDCSALAGMVEVTGVPTSKCVPRNPCSSRGQYNPCGSGTCVNPGDGTYSCQCPTGYAIGAASDGTQTCVGVAGGPASFLAYPTVPGDSCSSVAAAFGLTTAGLTALNPFLNCSLAYLPPTLILTVANASSTSISPSAPLCTATYTVQPNDTCTTLANTFFAGSLSALRAANPLTCTTSRFFLYPSQVICTATSALSSLAAVPIPQCGQTYTTVAGDTCSSVATKFAISLGAFMGLNSALSCATALPVGLYVCVAPKSTQFLSAGLLSHSLARSRFSLSLLPSRPQTAVNCTAWYAVLQGDNCPNIWNAANLTESTFLAINPGIRVSPSNPDIRCQAPYLQVGQKVCINSPLLASLLTASSTSFSLYTVQPNDSLALISSRFITRCTSSSISPAAIAAANNILETSPLVANTQLIIPCDARVGILDCGCAQSLPVCGADYVTYPSYCDALCNYALPVIQDGVCSGCNAACTGRTGLAPAAGYGCTWSTCPYPNWKPLDSDCTVLQGDLPGKCCAVEQTVCENVCRATRDTLGGTTTQMQANYDSCYSQCMCCSRVPNVFSQPTTLQGLTRTYRQFPLTNTRPSTGFGARTQHGARGPRASFTQAVESVRATGPSAGVAARTEWELNVRRRAPLAERYGVRVERDVSADRIEELGAERWQRWWTPGPCAYRWDWRVEEQVLVTRGTLRVTPDECEESMEFAAGDLVCFPRWFFAELEFSADYEQRYRFVAYGDNC
ncbi:unnamed protein product [Closterium sp. NIES-65]|nr:unnamed protein product [Closterium sp. NIES-65]